MFDFTDDPETRMGIFTEEAQEAIRRHDPLEALRLAEAVIATADADDLVVPTNALLAHGYALSDLGRGDEALEAYRIARLRMTLAGDRAGEAHVDMNVALVLGQEGRHDEAVELLEDALAVHLADRFDDDAIAACRTNLISALRSTGRIDDALEMGRVAIEVQRGPTGDRQGLANALQNVANVHLAIDELQPAREMFLEALDLFRKLDLPTEEADCLSAMGQIARREGLFDFAVAMHTEAIARYEGRGHPIDQAIARYHLAVAELWRGNPLAALQAATLATGVPGSNVDPAMIAAAALDQLGRRAEAEVERRGFIDRNSEEFVTDELTRIP